MFFSFLALVFFASMRLGYKKKDEKQCGCFSTFAFKREVSTNLVLKREEKMGKMLLALIEDSGYLKGKMSLFLINPNVPTAKFSLHYAWGD